MARPKKAGIHLRKTLALAYGPPPEPGEIRLSKVWLSGRTEVSQTIFISQIYALLEEHLNDSSMNVNWLADKLTINRKMLYRKVQSLIQLAPAELIQQYRLRRAADLLVVGHTVSETAHSVGFSTASHFTTVFKTFYRQTPTEFIASQQIRLI
jgi:AraC-like DNA-binding protein